MKKYDISVHLPTAVMLGTQTPEEYIESLADSLVNEYVYGRRFDFDTLRKLVDIAEERYEARWI